MSLSAPLDGTLSLEGVSRRFEVRCLPSVAAGTAYVTALIKADIEAALRANGRALMIGAGGSTPKAVYESLAKQDLDFTKLIVAQVDERFVPLEDASSNSLMIATAMAPAIAKGLRFQSLIEDLSDLKLCAQKAQARLNGLCGEAPQFDLGLLGMGADAHYASIFPDHPINATIYETKDWVVAIDPLGGGQEPRLPRLSLSVAALNGAKSLILWITGQDKLDVLAKALKSKDRYKAPIGAFLDQAQSDVRIIWAP